MTRRRTQVYWSSVLAVGLLSLASFVVFVIHPRGFESQIGWFFALLPGAAIAVVFGRTLRNFALNLSNVILWSSIIGLSFAWYFVWSFLFVWVLRRNRG